jgi:uncharacterized membrane protein SirB2
VSVTLFNYNYKYGIVPIIYGIILYYLKIKNKPKLLRISSFIILFYVFISVVELNVHKHIMHCDKTSTLAKILKYIPFTNDTYLSTCDEHIQHHVDVEPDMSINDTKKEHLFMGWGNYIYILIASFACLIGAKHISNIKISLISLFLISIIIAFLWEYLWNKIHIKMHNFEMEYSIEDGPYDNGLFNLDFIKNILLKNHTKHHLQKGKTKGNYNVIFLGADEWFGLNVKNIDNVEYCKTHTNEKICK